MGRKVKDLTGQRFGRLVALEIAEKDKWGSAIWKCKCDCGNIVKIRSGVLCSGATKSCGCYRKEFASESNFKDLTGQRFGRLVVLEIVGKAKSRSYVWKCQCDCGNVSKVSSNNLLSGHTQSCGCYNKECLSEANFKDLTSQRFGKLVTIGVVGKDKDGYYVWKCECDCGNITEVTSNRLLAGNTQSCGCLSESLVASELKQYCVENYSAIPEYKELKNPKTGYYLPYDIYIPDGFYIEVQGSQHYEYIQYFHGDYETFQYNQWKDDLKREHAEQNGVFIAIDLREIKSIEQAVEYLESILDQYL